MPVTITNYRELFATMAQRPRMFLIRDDFATAVAYIDGCDQGNAHTLLTGFREWLLTQAGCGDNLVWWSLILKIVAPGGTGPASDLPPEIDAQAKEMMFRRLDEFLELRTEPDGLRRIYAAHAAWRAARQEHGCQATGADTCPRVDWPRASTYPTGAGSTPAGSTAGEPPPGTA